MADTAVKKVGGLKRFRLVAGMYRVGDVNNKKGSIIKSRANLDKIFPTTFERLSSGAKETRTKRSRKASSEEADE
jgi:hypothetical protein